MDSSGTDLDASHLSVSNAKFKDTTLRRQDKEIERLTKANFDLQLRLFHLEEKLASIDVSFDMSDSENRFVSLLEEKQREVEEKENLLVKARQVIYALQDTVEERKMDLEDSSFHETAVAQAKAAAEQVTGLKEEVIRLKSDLESDKANAEQVPSLEAEISRLQSELEALDSRVEELRTHNAQLGADSEGRRERIDALESQLHVVHDEKAQLEENLQCLEAQREQLQTQLHTRHGEHAELEKVLECAERERTELQSQLVAERAQHEQLKETLSSSTAQTQELEMRLDAEREGTERLQGELQSTTDGRRELAEQLQTRQEEVAQLHAQLQSMCEAKAQLELGIRQQQDETAQLQARLQSAGEQKEMDVLSLRLALEEANGVAAESDVQARKWKELAEEMESEVEAVRTERDEESEAHHRVIDALQVEVKKLRARADEDSAAIFSHTTELEERAMMLQEQLEDSRSEFSKVCQERAQLHTRIDRLEVELRTRGAGAQQKAAEDADLIKDQKQSIENLREELAQMQIRQSQDTALHAELKVLQAEVFGSPPSPVLLPSPKALALVDITNYDDQNTSANSAKPTFDDPSVRALPWKSGVEAATTTTGSSPRSIDDDLNEQRGMALGTASWKYIVLQQLETSRRLSMQMARNVEEQRKKLIHGLAL